MLRFYLRKRRYDYQIAKHNLAQMNEIARITTYIYAKERFLN